MRPMPKILLKVTRIVLTVAGAIIMVDCAVLMAMGKINFGTVVPFLLGTVFVAHGLYWQKISQFVNKKRGLKWSWYGLWGGFSLWLLSFGVFVNALQQQIALSRQPLPDVAAIIILGAGTINGKPTPTLAKRLDAAVPLINAQPQVPIITSGGIGLGRSRSEADIMASYLNEEHGVALERIFEEGKSTSTEENLIYSQPILKDQGIAITDPNTPIAIVTSDFHTVRSAAIARHQGYQQPIMVTSPTPLSTRYNSWFREYFAFVSGWILGEY